MIRTVLAVLAAAVLALTLSIPALAQDNMAKPAATQGKDMPKEMNKDMKMEGLKMASCETTCGFRVMSHNQQEIVDIVKTHAKKMHNKDVTDAEVMKLIKDAPMKPMKAEGEQKPKY